VGLSLTPRRLRDYTNPGMEWILASLFGTSFALAGRYYISHADHHSFRAIFGVPFLLLYVQVGIIFIKQLVVSWRSPIPQTDAAEHIEWREQTRKYYLVMCDWHRLSFAAGAIFFAAVLTVSPDRLGELMRYWFYGWLIAGTIATVIVEIK